MYQDQFSLPDDVLATISFGLETLESVPGRRFHPHFIPTLAHLSGSLLKFVSLTSGRPHPEFPTSILRYHLLQDDQLDCLARHYHQVWPPTPETFRYPKPIQAWLGTPDEYTLDTETKRTRMARFIGLAGREAMYMKEIAIITSTATTAITVEESAATTEINHIKGSIDDEKIGVDNDGDRCTEIREMMENEWRAALRRAYRETGTIINLMEKGRNY